MPVVPHCSHWFMCPSIQPLTSYVSTNIFHCKMFIRGCVVAILVVDRLYHTSMLTNSALPTDVLQTYLFHQKAIVWSMYTTALLHDSKEWRRKPFIALVGL